MRSFLAMLVLTAAVGCREQADLAVVAEKIVTMSREKPIAEVMLIRDGKILKVGDRQSLRREVEAARERLELPPGLVVYPGFLDAHVHVAEIGRSLEEVDLVGKGSLEEALEAVAEAARRIPEGKWILGRGWDHNDWPVKSFPTKMDLDRVAPAHPVCLWRIDGHVVWVNSRALALAGIDASTKDPPGGVIGRVEGTQEPSGILIDNAMDFVSRVLPQPTPEDLERYLARAMDHFASLGLTCVHDAGVDSPTFAAYRKLVREGKAKIRVYVMASPGPLLDLLLAQGPILDPGRDMLMARALKLFADGAMGSRGALLFEPYADDPSNYGLNLTSPETLYDLTVRCLKKGIQVCTHAIGDRANRMVLDVYERALQEVPVPDARLRIEHAQVLRPEDVPRFARLGVIASMQPTHATSDMPWAESRLGPERVKGAYAWRWLLDAGARIAGGSDAPVESANPLLGLYAAVTRQDLRGFPDGGWLPEQRVSLEEALRMFTTEAAWACFAERTLGSLEPGKWADFVVIDRDLSRIPPREIPGAKVVLTAVAGRIVHRANEYLPRQRPQGDQGINSLDMPGRIG
ncbi:MAG: amidohydrolase [candidate division KSB1 bacterium]|nr:amidohydrolase [candidate division KSB1 bacterium]